MLRIFMAVAFTSAVMLFVSVAAISYYSSSPSALQNEQQRAGDIKAETRDKDVLSLRGFFRFMFPDAISIFTFWLFVATVVLAVVAVVQIGFLSRAEKLSAEVAGAARTQAKAAAEANIAATKALHQSQRPWVVAESIEFAKPIEFGSDRYEITLNLNLKNTGSSIATDVFTVMRLEANQTITLEKNWNKTDSDMAARQEHVVKVSKWPLGIVLAPGQTVPQPFGFGGPTADEGSPSKARIIGGAYYLMGLITYKDQFGITHKTRFSFNPDPWDGKTLVVSGGMQEAD